jgi:PleD family two-component response regulator
MHDGVSSMSVPGGGRVRISAGIAELRHGETAAGLFERADSALYTAKDLGKNRASVASD